MQNRSQHGHCLNAVSCAGVLADQSFEKNPSMKFVFRITDAFRRGAEEVVRLARLTGAQAAILKERSPSCGSGEIYDGTFTGTVVEGWGVTAELLRREGIPVLGESRMGELLTEGEAR